MFKTDKRIHYLYLMTDFVLINLTLYICYSFRFNKVRNLFYNPSLPNLAGYLSIFIFWTVLVMFFLKKENLYSTSRSLTIASEIFRVFVGNVYATIIIAAFIFVAQYKFFSRDIFFRSFIFLCIFLSFWRVIKRLILRRLIAEGLHNVNVLIVGAGKIGRIILEEIRRTPYWGLKVVGFLDDTKNGDIDNVPVLGKLSDFVLIAKNNFVEQVIITIPSEKKAVSGLINKIKNMRLGMQIVPENFEQPLPVLDINYLGITPLLTYKIPKRHPGKLALKRFFDFLASLILIISFLPLFFIIAVLIKLGSRGPVLYIQKRSGYKGRIFNFYKFRSMVKDADKLKDNLRDKNEAKGDIIFKIKRDPRVAGLGRFLRKFSLDELPQLFNVLRGDMSLIGPRPFPIEESQKFNSDHLERFTMRPGMTGLAQIKGRSDLSIYRWVKWDLWYVNNWSFSLDFLILLRTIPVTLKGKGAY